MRKQRPVLGWSKTCPQCDQTKNAGQFYAKATGGDGRDNVCSDCRLGEHREYQRRHKQETGLWSSQRYQRDQAAKRFVIGQLSFGS